MIFPDRESKSTHKPKSFVFIKISKYFWDQIFSCDWRVQLSLNHSFLTTLCGSLQIEVIERH